MVDCVARSTRCWVRSLTAAWGGHEDSHSAGEETKTQNRGATALGLSWSAVWLPGGHANLMSEVPLTRTAVC